MLTQTIACMCGACAPSCPRFGAPGMQVGQLGLGSGMGSGAFWNILDVRVGPIRNTQQGDIYSFCGFFSRLLRSSTRSLVAMGRRSAWELARDPRTIATTMLLICCSVKSSICSLYDHTLLKLPGDGHERSEESPWGAEITSLPGFTGKLRSRHYSGRPTFTSMIRHEFAFERHTGPQ
jgi:hypothetical protein